MEGRGMGYFIQMQAKAGNDPAFDQTRDIDISDEYETIKEALLQMRELQASTAPERSCLAMLVDLQVMLEPNDDSGTLYGEVFKNGKWSALGYADARAVEALEGLGVLPLDEEHSQLEVYSFKAGD